MTSGILLATQTSTVDAVWEVAKQVPALIVLAYLVIKFFEFMTKAQESVDARETARDTTFFTALKDQNEEFLRNMDRISNECHAVQDRSTKVMEKNSEAVTKLCGTVDRLEERLSRYISGDNHGAL